MLFSLAYTSWIINNSPTFRFRYNEKSLYFSHNTSLHIVRKTEFVKYSR